ncbi:MAG: pyridoxamine 5'-phosphate oxidase family protein [Acidobacteriota bacterium]|nr:pyridoxamine 5'-phosphate oxidase family protein [Acidobacteriota bacterium]
MWIDERGSEVLGLPECRRLLAVGAQEHRHGHLSIAEDDAPTVLPINYVTRELDVVVVVGEGLFHRIVNRLVAFQVDGVSRSERFLGAEDVTPWSVLLKGLATEEPLVAEANDLPALEVSEPGHRTVRIRADVLTGRKLGHRQESRDSPATPGLHLVSHDAK